MDGILLQIQPQSSSWDGKKTRDNHDDDSTSAAGDSDGGWSGGFGKWLVSVVRKGVNLVSSPWKLEIGFENQEVPRFIAERILTPRTTSGPDCCSGDLEPDSTGRSNDS